MAGKPKVIGWEFSDGARFQQGAKLDPSLVGDHLEALRKRCKGEVTPQDILNDAKKRTSPLHSFFEWDDGKAAEQHRLHQARGLIRSVVAIYKEDDKPPVRTRAFIHIPEGETSNYRSADHAMSQTSTRELVMRRAWRELMQWKARYKDLAEFATLFVFVDALAKTIDTGEGPKDDQKAA